MIKLNIRNDKNKIVKTYQTEEVNLKMGTVEDIVEIINIDKLLNNKEDTSVNLYDVIATVAMNSYRMCKPIIKDVFPQITDEELRNINFKEVVNTVVDIIKYSISDINNVFGTSKN